MFAEDNAWPYNYEYINPNARIAPTDAKFVDIIHTDGKQQSCFLGACSYIPFGTMIPLGDADFYLGSPPAYGFDQSNCNDDLFNLGCSHRRAHAIYLATIKGTICSASSVCHGDISQLCRQRSIVDIFVTRVPCNCKAIKTKFEIGYWLDAKETGSFTVAVSGRKPYCQQ